MEMPQLFDESYRTLAKKLDELPNRFPATPNNGELRLLAKLFTPTEASLASVLDLDGAPAADVATRAGMDPRDTREHLKRMAAKGLIDLKRGAGEFLFAIKPFVVGFYETQLPRLDDEMASLIEAYFVETQGAILRERPALHRVIPVERSIPFQVEIQPYEQASELLSRAESWGVRECICRAQQRRLGKGCDGPKESCLVFAPVKNAFDRSKVDRAITKEEALQILRTTEEAGLVHSAGNFRDGVDYICNCCTCCCGIMRGIAEFGVASAVAHSDFRAVVNTDACPGCGACIDRCQFGALAVPELAVVVDYRKCMGCGLCIAACPADALQMEHRPAEEVLLPPMNIEDWRNQRNQSRNGVSMGSHS